MIDPRINKPKEIYECPCRMVNITASIKNSTPTGIRNFLYLFDGEVFSLDLKKPFCNILIISFSKTQGCGT